MLHLPYDQPKAANVISKFTARPARVASATRASRLNLPTSPRNKSFQSRLRHAETACGLRLRHIPRRHGLADRNHQPRAKLHVFGFRGSVFQCIPRAFKDFRGHRQNRTHAAPDPTDTPLPAGHPPENPEGRPASRPGRRSVSPASYIVTDIMRGGSAFSFASSDAG